MVPLASSVPDEFRCSKVPPPEALLVAVFISPCARTLIVSPLLAIATSGQAFGSAPHMAPAPASQWKEPEVLVAWADAIPDKRRSDRVNSSSRSRRIGNPPNARNRSFWRSDLTSGTTSSLRQRGPALDEPSLSVQSSNSSRCLGRP